MKTKRKDIAETYNKFKIYKGKQYTGMTIGRKHKWKYDKGEWKEQKKTPDLWEFEYSVKKRRAGKAPEGSGVPVGTAYHWAILAHQTVEKLDANTYATSMKGIKYKVAHKRAGKEGWSASERAQKKRLVEFLEDIVKKLKKELEKKESLPSKVIPDILPQKAA